MLDEMELYVSETHISTKNPVTMSKIYEDTCRILANENKEVYHLCVMLRNRFVNVFTIMCGFVSRTNASDFTK